MIFRDNIKWNDKSDLKKRLYYVSVLSTNPGKEEKKYGVVQLIKHNKLKTSNDKYLSEGDFLKKSDSIKCIKVKIDRLGNISKA